MILFLSPHYDDAIYSCGGTIHQLAQQNEKTHIFTIMAAIPQPPYPQSPIVQDIHQRWQAGAHPIVMRRAEDQKAVKIIGTQASYGTLLDCIYRTHTGTALYPSEASLFGAIHPDDDINQLKLPFNMQTVKIIYAPLTAGHHVDHQLVRRWSFHLLAQYPHITLRLYADYPYTRDDDAIAQAMSSLAHTLIPQHTEITEANLAVKIRAMAAYRSQISTFWKDKVELAADVRHAFTDDNSSTGYLEKAWQIQAHPLQ